MKFKLNYKFWINGRLQLNVFAPSVIEAVRIFGNVAKIDEDGPGYPGPAELWRKHLQIDREEPEARREGHDPEVQRCHRIDVGLCWQSAVRDPETRGEHAAISHVWDWVWVQQTRGVGGQPREEEAQPTATCLNESNQQATKSSYKPLQHKVFRTKTTLAIVEVKRLDEQVLRQRPYVRHTFRANRSRRIRI